MAGKLCAGHPRPAFPAGGTGSSRLLSRLAGLGAALCFSCQFCRGNASAVAASCRLGQVQGGRGRIRAAEQPGRAQGFAANLPPVSAFPLPSLNVLSLRSLDIKIH